MTHPTMTQEVAMLAAAAKERAEQTCGGPAAQLLDVLSRNEYGTLIGTYTYRCSAPG